MSLERSTLTVPEAAAALGVHRLTLYKLIRDGKSPVPYVQVGRRIVVPRAALERLLGETVAPRRKKAS